MPRLPKDGAVEAYPLARASKDNDFADVKLYIGERVLRTIEDPANGVELL